MNNEMVTKIQNLLNTTTDKGASEAEAKTAILLAQKLMAKHGLEMSDIESSQNPEDKKEVVEGSTGEQPTTLTWWEKNLSMIIADNFRCYTFIRGYLNIGSKVVFLGLKDDVEIAKSIYQFASAQIMHHAKLYRKARRKEQEEQVLGKGFRKLSFDDLVGFASEKGIPSYKVSRILRMYSDEKTQRKQLTTLIKDQLGASIDGTAIRNDYISGFLAGLKENFEAQKEANKEEWGLVLVKDDAVVEHYEGMKFSKGRSSRVSRSGDADAYSEGVKQGKSFQSSSGYLE